jgi:antitoxin component YwqK of YwqJK toxin-antitoxin module
MVSLFFIFSAFAEEFITDTAITGVDTTIKWQIISDSKAKVETYKTFNGKIDGIYTKWYKTGEKKSISYYHLDTLDSGYIYFPSGKIKSVMRHTGLSISFCENGDTSSVGYRKNGKSFGLVRSYYPNRHSSSILNYDTLGQKHGLCETWREDGTRRDSTVYKNGQYVEARDYYANGKISFHATYSGMATRKRIASDSSTLEDDFPQIINAESFSFKGGKPIAQIKKGFGISILCDSLGGDCDTFHYVSGVPVPKDCKPRPKGVSKKAFPKKGECWFDVIPVLKK